jgi:hypothetical protein
MDDDHIPSSKPDMAHITLCLLGTLGWLLVFFAMAAFVWLRLGHK